MVTDFEELVTLCDSELHDRDYTLRYIMDVRETWQELRAWLESKGITEFSVDIANEFCDLKFGFHVLPPKTTEKQRRRLRAIRLLISYQLYGDFEFRSPSAIRTFEGETGKICSEYLIHCEQVLKLAESTVSNKRLYLVDFNHFINIRGLNFSQIDMDVISDFFVFMNYSLASRHNAALTLKLFFRFAFDKGHSSKDYSVYVPGDTYRKNCKLPTTYEEDEIKKMIEAVERGSAIGKRDYLVLLLACEYGMRALDITQLCFDDIDWDRNVIRITLNKTDYPVEYPLTASVGNAIIDYLKHGRPKTNAPQIIVSQENANKGKPLSPRTIHSIVTRYLRRARIANIDNKRHGPHALRHSLATNLLKKNVAMPIISTVMGHQNTSTTSVYISVDYDKLKLCALPMPKLHSPLYMKENYDAKI